MSRKEKREEEAKQKNEKCRRLFREVNEVDLYAMGVSSASSPGRI